MSISNETIELIRDRARIEEIVGRYVPSLKQKGRNYIGLCPFHKEKTPSFTVSPDKQIFHCFGCHEGGNVFSFVGKLERLNFPESVKAVGKMVGIDVTEDSREADEYQEYKRINTFAMKVYQASLQSPANLAGLEYLEGRGVTADSIKAFHLGYSPDAWDFLKSKLIEKKADLDKAVQLGLLAKKDKEDGKKHYYDIYRGRVIFPIIDRYDQVAGFGGRIIGSGEPKYLNSPDSPIYKKREILYGFNLAKNEISSSKRAIIVEGYLDVIGCHQAGVRNVVAPLGTALTEEQVRFIARFAEEVVLLFDADAAGLKASLRSLSVVKEVNLSIKVARLPEDDPFDYVLKYGADEFLAIVNAGLPPAEFRIRHAIFANESKGAKNVTTAVFEIIREMEYETERVECLKTSAALLGVDYLSLKNDFARFGSGEKPEERHEVRKKEADFVNVCFRELIVVLCNYPSLIAKASFDFTGYTIPDPLLGRIFSKLLDIYALHEEITSDRLFDMLTEKDEEEFLRDAVTGGFEYEHPDEVYTEIFIDLKKHEVEKKIEFYAQKIKSNANGLTMAEYLTELDLWKREHEKLNSYLSEIRGGRTGKKEVLGF